MILVTGGAGFIGSHLVDDLLAAGERVRVLDCIEPQAHPHGPRYRNPDAEYIEASVRDLDAVSSALDGCEAVVHLAAQVGVGQSMYEPLRYVGDNCLGTATLLQALIRHPVTALVVASSMSIYGEGEYFCPGCGLEDAPARRTDDRLRQRLWEPACGHCGSELLSRATRESKRLEAASTYAISKRDQEELCLVFGRAYGVRTIALRFFNTYGPRQSLSNPYTGAAAIFASRLVNRRPPLVFEDGLQTRDFVHVSDVVQAIERALRAHGVGDVALNVGTGVPTPVGELPRLLAVALGLDIRAELTNDYRQGDIRHCTADITRARELLGFDPRVRLGDGMRDLVHWIGKESPDAVDAVARSREELDRDGLVL